MDAFGRSELPLEGAKEALEAEALERAKTQLPEIERAARKRLEEEAEEKMRQSAAASIEREVCDRLIREAEERLRAAEPSGAQDRQGPN